MKAPRKGPPTSLRAEVHFDCVHYRGDRPCAPHKARGVHCPSCDEYRPVRTRLLMIKLDAMGDVLRTTCLLPALAARHEGLHVTWVTNPESMPLLVGNPYVQRIVSVTDAPVLLATERFDLAVNLDSSPRSSALLTMASARTHRGFLMSPAGYVFPAGEREVTWFLMGLFDDHKKANTRSYQELTCEILDLDPSLCRYVLVLDEEERAWARELARLAGIPAGRPIVGLNTGAGGRWQYKRWRPDGFRDLIGRVRDVLGASVLLLGGHEEESLNRALAEGAAGRAVRPGDQPGAAVGVFLSGSQPVRRFAGIVGLCDAVVTGDTLGLHIALAMGVGVIALFGPTSAAEIELFGLGTRIVPEMDCLVCYLERCDKKPACMDLIGVDQVLGAVATLLERRIPP